MKSHESFKWTKEAVERLTFLWCQEGASASVIAQVLSNEFRASVSRNSVIGKAHRLRLEHPNSGAVVRKARKSNIPVVKQSLTTETSWNPGQLKPRPSRPPESLLPPVVAHEHHIDDALPEFTDRIQLVDLRETTCRFPIGDPTMPEFRFCGAPSPIGRPYCDHHHRVVYVRHAPAKPRKNGNHHGMRVVQLAAY